MSSNVVLASVSLSSKHGFCNCQWKNFILFFTFYNAPTLTNGAIWDGQGYDKPPTITSQCLLTDSSNGDKRQEGNRTVHLLKGRVGIWSFSVKRNPGRPTVAILDHQFNSQVFLHLALLCNVFYLFSIHVICYKLRPILFTICSYSIKWPGVLFCALLHTVNYARQIKQISRKRPERGLCELIETKIKMVFQWKKSPYQTD